MQAIITQRTFSYVPDKILQLSGEYLRQFRFSNSWIRIRLGVLCAITPDVSEDGNTLYSINDCTFVLGVCSGTNSFANPTGYVNTFVGASIIGMSGAGGGARLATIATNGSNPYYTFTAGKIIKTVENVTTSLASTSAMLGVPANTGVIKRRAAYYVDIARGVAGTGAATINVYGPSGPDAQANFDTRPSEFLACLDQQGAPVLNGVALPWVASFVTTIGEEFGALDTFNLAWTRSMFPLEISALGASVQSTSVYVTPAGSIDSFEQYVINGTIGLSANGYAYPVSNGSIVPVNSGTLTGGTNWTGTWVVNGSWSNLIPQMMNVQIGNVLYSPAVTNYWGTSLLMPTDDFEQYAAGAVTTGVTINAGTGWAEPAYIYT
jgi:hypothetical protein